MGVRIAALGDLHFSRTSAGSFQKLLSEIAAAADVLLVPGDLTDYGLPEEARLLVRELAVAKVPTVAVFGNHDYEGSPGAEVDPLSPPASWLRDARLAARHHLERRPDVDHLSSLDRGARDGRRRRAPHAERAGRPRCAAARAPHEPDPRAR